LRIRALKPGFFKNEQLAELSPWHRLCFQGLWCCADRAGRLQDRPKRLKAEIFPYDDLDMNHLLWDLARAGFIRRYQIGAHPYVWIPSWGQHQHPRQDEGDSTFPAYEEGTDRESITLDVSTFPAARPAELVEHTRVPAIVTDPSLSSHAAVTVPRIGQLEVGQVEVGSGTSGETAADAALALVAPHFRAQDLMDLWNATIHPPIPKCRELSDERRRKIRARIGKRPLLAEWREAFEYLDGEPFYRGENDRGWTADFDYVIRNDTVVAKLLERARTPRGASVILGKQSSRLLAAVAQLPDTR
jgi:hypothetical protein